MRVFCEKSMTLKDLPQKEGCFENDYFEFHFENGNFEKMLRNLVFSILYGIIPVFFKHSRSKITSLKDYDNLQK
jgi:hypothetical protein